MFRNILLLMDFGVFIFVIIMLMIKPPGPDAEAWLAIIGIIVFLLMNIFFIFGTESRKESIIALYFRRKTLEEKKKIKKLNQSEEVSDETSLSR